MSNDNKRDHLRKLEHALDALGLTQNTNMMMVPVKPSKYMIDIGASAGGVDLETAKTIYEAMVTVNFFDPIGSK